MAEFWGMETDQVENFGSLATQRRGSIEDRFQDLHATVQGIIGSSWVGQDADSFRDRFESEVVPASTRAAETLQSLVEDLRRQIGQQDDASSTDGGGSGGGSGGGGANGGPASGPISGGPAVSPVMASMFNPPGSIGEFGSKFWDKFVDNLFHPGGDDAATTMISITHDLPTWLMKNVPKAIPVLGDAYTGLLSGVQRFAAESDRPMGERLGRAAIDGVLTGAGSFVGSTLGTIGGAGLGVLAGGGSLGAAGAAIGAVAGEGIGAIPGAAGGLGTGAVVGGVAGGVIGDIAGGYVGGAAGNALASSFLD